jgi:3D (Asp-Asp-Asp) domain-containing protein
VARVTLLAVALWTVTAYGLTCDAPGPLTKAGTRPVAGFTIAADPRVLPLGSIVWIEGLGERQVHDIGGAVRGKHVDVYVSNCREARQWGRQARLVRVLHRGGRR